MTAASRFALLLVLAAGCGSDPSPAPTPDPKEKATFDRGAKIALALVQTARLAGGLIGFDGSLDPPSMAEVIVPAVETRIKAMLPACGTVVRDGAKLTVQVDEDPGCPVGPGVWGKGKMSIAFESLGAALTALLTFDPGFQVSGFAIEGQLSLTTVNGWGFLGTPTLTVEGGTMVSGDLDILGSLNRFTITTGHGSVGGELSLTLEEVVSEGLDCYPRGGSLRVSAVGVDVRGYFELATATSGVVTMTPETGATWKTLLPDYAFCNASL